METSGVASHKDLSDVYETINKPAPRSHVGREAQSFFLLLLLTKGVRQGGGEKMGGEVVDQHGGERGTEVDFNYTAQPQICGSL